ncbi:right-handed parallel beta-helix repeat-containing protein [Aeromicrobium fastidiosum]|uniref:Right-handed parallel beta-helix repeat-containing protein n=1 Tax=Aeromicrobium fastidiosum TaxID=52699 RepID=A0A641AK65_9ACTN|nr:right-handed parallel beta-helix repeat-containing protein [Aeromicrobium fastidiosum]KAA1374815.1 right-handed parallel beta-helix repeat-containing protein [Aeromicrobium fastidiosum]MBP2390629.1 hypothetical protein [Aeromicrobium fastidiosum]
MSDELPSPGLTDEERGTTVSRRRRIAAFAGVAVLIAAAVVGIALGADRTDDAPNRPDRPAAAAPSARALPDASAPAAGDIAQAQLVEDEDARIWKAVSLGTSTSGGVRTVVLDRRDVGGAYGLDDLVTLGAATRTSPSVVTLDQSVVVRTGARLEIHRPGLTLRLGGADDSFASIVAWGGSLSLRGSTSKPLTVEGWDTVAGTGDTDVTDGRGYLRAHSGRLDLRDTVLTHLGFWSGRTGGTAVTGTTFDPGRARVRDSRIADDHIGLYLYGTKGVSVARTSITGTDRDGIELDRSTGARLTAVTVDGAGLNGLRAHDHSSKLRIVDARLTGSAGYGITIDGRPRASGPNALGYGVDSATGLTVSRTTVSGNASGGVQVSGTDEVALDGLTVTQDRRPLRLVGRSTSTVVRDSSLTSGRGPVVQVDDGARGVVLRRSTLVGTTSGVDVTSSQVEVVDNEITVGRGIAVSVAGARAAGTIRGNTVVGEGPDAFAVPEASGTVTVADNTTTGWRTTHRVLEWVEHNPFAPLWVAILLVPAIGVTFILRRHRMHRDLRRLTEETVIAMAKARRRGTPVAPAIVLDPVLAPAAASATAPVETRPATIPPPPPPPEEVTRTDRLVTRGAMGQFASAEDLAIHAVLQGGKSPIHVARTLQVPVAVVERWLRQHEQRTQA